jgi:hypothetical protein
MKKLIQKIKTVKKQINELGDLRPGNLTKQIAKGEGKKPREYWQLSYTHNMKSRTEYVRNEFVKQIKEEVANYKKLKQLMETWIDLSIQLSKEKLETLKKQK